MSDFSELSGKELADMVRVHICGRFDVFGPEYDILHEVIRRLETPDALLKSLDEALNMGDGTYRP